MLRGLSSAPFWLVQCLPILYKLTVPGQSLTPYTRVYRTHRCFQNRTLSFLLVPCSRFPPSHPPQVISVAHPSKHCQALPVPSPNPGAQHYSSPIVLYLLFLQSLQISLPEEIAGPTSREFSSLKQPNICTTSPHLSTLDYTLTTWAYTQPCWG